VRSHLKNRSRRKPQYPNARESHDFSRVEDVKMSIGPAGTLHWPCTSWLKRATSISSTLPMPTHGVAATNQSDLQAPTRHRVDCSSASLSETSQLFDTFAHPVEDSKQDGKRMCPNWRVDSLPCIGRWMKVCSWRIGLWMSIPPTLIVGFSTGFDVVDIVVTSHKPVDLDPCGCNRLRIHGRVKRNLQRAW